MNLKTVRIVALVLAGIVGLVASVAGFWYFRPGYGVSIAAIQKQVRGLESQIAEANAKIDDLQKKYDAVNEWKRKEGSKRVAKKVQVVRDADAVGLCHLMDDYVKPGVSADLDSSVKF